MNITEKAKIIGKIDSDFQHRVGSIANDWEALVYNIYMEAKGNKNGWPGIAEEDPQVIEELYPIAINFGK